MHPKLFAVFLLGCLLSLQLSHAWVAHRREPKTAVQCTAENGELYNPGEKWYEGEQCAEYACSGEPHNLVVHITGCGSVSGPEECTVESGEGQYPECCPQVICP